MRQGYRVIDADTHVTPSVEVLVEYGDRELKDRADELTPYVRMTKPTAGRGHPTHPYGVVRVNPHPYNRVAGHKQTSRQPLAAPAPRERWRAGFRTWR